VLSVSPSDDAEMFLLTNLHDCRPSVLLFVYIYLFVVGDASAWPEAACTCCNGRKRAFRGVVSVVVGRGGARR